MEEINIKRIYDEPADNDGYRVLVDRLWPRGISKKGARLLLYLETLINMNGHEKQQGI